MTAIRWSKIHKEKKDLQGKSHGDLKVGKKGGKVPREPQSGLKACPCLSIAMAALTDLSPADPSSLQDKWRNWQRNVSGRWATARVQLPLDLKLRIERVVRDHHDSPSRDSRLPLFSSSRGDGGGAAAGAAVAGGETEGGGLMRDGLRTSVGWGGGRAGGGYNPPSNSVDLQADWRPPDASNTEVSAAAARGGGGGGGGFGGVLPDMESLLAQRITGYGSLIHLLQQQQQQQQQQQTTLVSE